MKSVCAWQEQIRHISKCMGSWQGPESVTDSHLRDSPGTWDQPSRDQPQRQSWKEPQEIQNQDPVVNDQLMPQGPGKLSLGLWKT